MKRKKNRENPESIEEEMVKEPVEALREEGSEEEENEEVKKGEHGVKNEEQGEETPVSKRPKVGEKKGSSIMTSEPFSRLELSQPTMEAIKEMGFENMTREKLLGENYYLNQTAKDAYRSYILSYNSHSMKNIFNVHHLNLKDIAASFCFSSPPEINLDLESSASKFRKKVRQIKGNRHGISASNPYGKQHSEDKRQFTRR